MNDWLPSLNSLRAFEAVVRLRGYKTAADELAVTPAAVKQLVQKLERAIGEPLLERKGREIVPTATGVRGFVELRPAFLQIAEAVQLMRAVRQRDRLVVSVDPSFASAWLVPYLQAFRQENPGDEVLIDSSMRLADLHGGAADVGIRFGVEQHGDLVVHRLFDETLCALCSPSIAAGPPPVTDLAALARAPLLRWDLTHAPWAVNTQRWNHWRTWLGAIGAGSVTPGLGPKFTDYNLAVQAAIAGQGFVLGSEPVLQRLLAARLLVNPFGLTVKPGIGYDLVTTAEAMRRPVVARFVEWLLRVVRETG